LKGDDVAAKRELNSEVLRDYRPQIKRQAACLAEVNDVIVGGFGQIKRLQAVTLRTVIRRKFGS
jgi:hypothetical protein